MSLVPEPPRPPARGFVAAVDRPSALARFWQGRSAGSALHKLPRPRMGLGGGGRSGDTPAGTQKVSLNGRNPAASVAVPTSMQTREPTLVCAATGAMDETGRRKARLLAGVSRWPFESQIY